MIPTKETTYRISGAPSLALLSDLHNTEPAPILSSLRSHTPSLICITGDVLYGSRPEGDVSPLETQEHVLPFLGECSSLAPTFLSLGNHEWMVDSTDLATISSTGVVVLDNEWRETAVDGKTVVIAGLTSAYVTDYRAFREEVGGMERYPRKESISGAFNSSLHKPETGWIDDFCSVDGFRVVMSHHPEYWPLLKDKNIDLVLSGHAHGGQWRIFGHGVWSPGQGWWPKWTKGVYENRLIVSAGLSNTTWVPRFGNPIEVVYIEP